MPDDGLDPGNNSRLAAVTFGLGVAALAGMITLAGHAARPALRYSEATVQAIAAASTDAPINLLGEYYTACTSPTNGQCG